MFNRKTNIAAQEGFGSAANSGKSIKVRGLQISLFADGKMVERWGSSDELGITTQLGLLAA